MGFKEYFCFLIMGIFIMDFIFFLVGGLILVLVCVLLLLVIWIGM